MFTHSIGAGNTNGINVFVDDVVVVDVVAVVVDDDAFDDGLPLSLRLSPRKLSPRVLLLSPDVVSDDDGESIGVNNASSSVPENK